MDKESFVAQVTACTGLMYHTAWTILHNEEDCRDALQDTVLRAWEKRHTLRDETRFKPWLLRILTNRCYSELRRRRQTVVMDALPEPAISPLDPGLAQALDALPEKLRLPLVLVYAEGMCYEEAAQALRLPMGTLANRIHRAKILLGKELEEP